jgi:hypothetical protein
LSNRLLPADFAAKGVWEQNIFWSLWGLALLHAFWRSSPVAKARRNPAWREQSLLIAILAVAAVIANWITTGDHLIKTVFTDTYWPVAGVDLSLIVTALIAYYAAAKLRVTASARKDIAGSKNNRNKRVNAYD